MDMIKNIARHISWLSIERTQLNHYVNILKKYEKKKKMMILMMERHRRTTHDRKIPTTWGIIYLAPWRSCVYCVSCRERKGKDN